MTGPKRLPNFAKQTKKAKQSACQHDNVAIPASQSRKGSQEAGSYLRDEPVEVDITGPLDVQRAPADVVDGLIVEQRAHVHVLQERVGGQHAVVRLHDRSGDLENDGRELESATTT